MRWDEKWIRRLEEIASGGAKVMAVVMANEWRYFLCKLFKK
jgi:hypothetical protein